MSSTSKCLECQRKFEKEKIPFSPSYCKFCSFGEKQHQKELRESEAERKWAETDWNSSKFKRFYKG